MCGFAGFLTFGNSRLDSEERRAVLVRMGKLLSHRGPDDEQFYDDGTLSLVYRRLSIVDLDGGQQPIFNEDGDRFIVVNGEIYNHLELRKDLTQRHTFSTHSDSEVALHLFEDQGVDALAHLRGMFALAIWERRERALFLARDRLGIKPLYVCRLPNGLLFGSELKALLAHPDCPREIQWQDLRETEAVPLSPVPSYVRHVEHLPGGHYLLAKGGRIETHCWWRISDHFDDAPFGMNSTGYRKEFERLVDEATQEHLLGDVPIGLHLSGGVDSSLLATVIAQKRHDVACFSVVDRNTWKCGDASSARQVTTQLGLPWFPVLFDHHTLLDEIAFDLRRLEQTVHMMDSPRFDLEWFFKEELHRFARRQYPDLKVVLLGQGIDEFAGGYSRRLDNPHSSWDAYLTEEVEPNLRYWRGVEDRRPEHLREFTQGADHGLSPYQRQMLAFANQLQHFQLWHEDRSSSSQSLEARVPYLDHRIVELLASVPADLQSYLFWNKRVVRDTLGRRLPSYDLEHPKVQFFLTDDKQSLNIVMHEMLQRCIPAFLDKYLDDPHLPFDADALRRFSYRVLSRQGNFYREGWRLMECLAIAIFARQLHSPDADDFSDIRRRRDGAPEIHTSQWDEVQASFANMPPTTKIAWNPQDRLALPDGVQVMASISDDHSYELVSASAGFSSISVPQGLAWVERFLRHLGNPAAADFTINDWADEFEIDRQVLVETLDTLHLAGFLVRRPAEAVPHFDAVDKA